MSKLDHRALRDAFGSYITGVTIVTCKAADGTPIGFTANSFTSVSLNPPLLLVCPGKFLSSYETFASCSHFAINVLAEGQEQIANTFANHKGDRFALTPYREDAFGNLLIEGAIAQFSCTTHEILEAGDHAVLIGAVRDFNQTAGRGLGYVGGQFFSLGLERAALEHSGGRLICGAIVTHGQHVLLEPTDFGYRPPQIVADDRGNLRQTLVRELEKSGVHVRLGPAYSVFDEEKAHNSYFLAETDSSDTTAFEAHPILNIPSLRITTRPIADMMNRFAAEAQSSNFGLYVGDAHRGDVHHLSERN